MVTSASAYTINLANPGAGTVNVGDPITIVMSGHFGHGTILWSASLGFDTLLVSYDRAGSNNLSGDGYALYTAGAGKTAANWLKGVGGGGGCPGYGDPGAGGGVWHLEPSSSQRGLDQLDQQHGNFDRDQCRRQRRDRFDVIRRGFAGCCDLRHHL